MRVLFHVPRPPRAERAPLAYHGAMILETERLVLRPYLLSDATAVHAYGSDPEVCRYTEFGPNTWDDTLGFLGTAIAPTNTTIDLAITVRGADEVVGGISAKPHPGGKYELGWVLRRDLWGRGVATEAAKALLAHVAALPGTTLVFARCRPENRASYRVMEKIGLRFAERVPREKEVRGEWVDSLFYDVDIVDGRPVPA